MSAHTYHLDTHEWGLADECPRCAEHAEHPLDSLDDKNLATLMERITNIDDPRSENERVAMANVQRAMDMACALATANPKAFTKYAGMKWGLRLIAAL